MADGTSRCPSAQPDQEDVRVLGLMVPTDEGRRVAYLNAELPATPEVLARVPAGLASSVLRLSSVCEEGRCHHFDGRNCGLANRVSRQLKAVTDRLPPCTIRRTCRWHMQEGPAVCFRCPQVATTVAAEDPLAAVALPPRPAAAHPPA